MRINRAFVETAFVGLFLLSAFPALAAPDVVCSKTKGSGVFNTGCENLKEEIDGSDGLGYEVTDSDLVKREQNIHRQRLQPPRLASNGKMKIISMNVGGADFHLTNQFTIESNCPAYKLCHPEVEAQILAFLTIQQPDVVFLQEIMNEDQLRSAVLPDGYDFRCGWGGGDHTIKEICLAWKKNSFQSIEPCRNIFTGHGGALGCVLDHNNEKIQFISVHPSAWNSSERRATQLGIWDQIAERHLPVIVAGDFNSEKGTAGIKSMYPAPAEFGTLFGTFAKGFGRIPSPSFFYGLARIRKAGIFDFIKKHSTVFGEKIDHAFSNFGRVESVCIGGDPGCHWKAGSLIRGNDFNFKIDHFPIVITLAW
ncbi:MAG: endonuclease/exonuclease/phosphatase family protein [Cryobacterium sp.]|nr:endonuclease/exonuclease/phosphatase family protein [Oligoflexia bacterium]